MLDRIRFCCETVSRSSAPCRATLGARPELSQATKHDRATTAPDRRIIGHAVRIDNCRGAASRTGELRRGSPCWRDLCGRQIHGDYLGCCGNGAIGVCRCPDPVVAGEVVGAPDAVSAGGLKYWKSGAFCSSSFVHATFSLMLVG